MANWEDRLQNVWETIQEKFTTPDAVLLGVCAFFSREFGIPVVLLRIVVFVCALLWPFITALVYVAARFFVNVDRDLSP